jgi:hypothetical protein
MDVQFSLLGPVRAWRGPAEVDLGPGQQRAVLALLLVRANQLVSIDDLIELLWEHDPPGSAVNTIHKYIGAIRRLIEPGLVARASGRWLTRHGGAYRLAADESSSDLIAFRRMVKDACPPTRKPGRPALSIFSWTLWPCGGEHAVRAWISAAEAGTTSRWFTRSTSPPSPWRLRLP